MQSTGFLDSLASICGFWRFGWFCRDGQNYPEKWGFESGGAARILPPCAPARPTAFLQTKNGRAAVRVGVVGKGGFTRRRCRPKKTRRSRTEFGCKVWARKWAKNARIFGLRRRHAEYLFLVYSCCKNCT